MIRVRLFCDWQNSATLTENILKDFRKTLQISNDNIYKDVIFTNSFMYDVGIHFNELNSESIFNNKIGAKNILVAMEPPELLDVSLVGGGKNVYWPDIKGNKEINYHPTIWTLHTELLFDRVEILPSQKNHKMSWIMSNKGITPTHNKRREIAHNIFYSNVGKYIDYFGTAFGNKRLDNKHEGLRYHSYSIAFENSLERGVLTEKFYDCIVNNCIPITNNKTAYEMFDENAFIYIDFNMSIDAIKNQLEGLLYFPIGEKQDEAIMKAKQEILYGVRNPVHEIYEIVKKVTQTSF